MASPLHSNQRESEDRLSALPDDILLQILYHLNLRTQILTSTLSRRWRHLPSMLTDLIINIYGFLPRTQTLTRGQLKKSMDIYAETTRRLLGSTSERAIRILSLSFYLTDPHLQAIGSAVGSIVEHGNTKVLGFNVMAEWHDLSFRLEANVQFGQRFMAFFSSCPTAFRWLTNLSIQNLRFNESDMSNLLDACDQLRFLRMSLCDSGPQSVLKIDAPRSQLIELVFDICSYIRVELIQVPNLVHVDCDTYVSESPPIVFGHVPLLRDISLTMMNGQPPLMLSNWLSNVSSLSTLTLDFENWEIWIKPEGPKRLSLIFSKLRDLHLCGIFFSENSLEWTLYLLEAAPSLKNFFLKVQRHKCARNIYKQVIDNQQRTNLQWKASADFKHHSLNLLEIKGFEVEYKIMRYIKRVMKHAVQLKMIRLQHKEPCDGCDDNDQLVSRLMGLASNFSRYEIDTDLIRELLADGLSSDIKIIII